jgi:FkbM family methyltransferase
MHLIRSAMRPRPEYLYRPAQICRRLLAPYRRSPTVVVSLPWGLTIEVDRHEAIGDSILRTGIHELGMTEAVWRLARPGGVAVDVGANAGYVSSITAARQGPGGVTLAFEPHPAVFGRLVRNVSAWNDDEGIGSIRAIEAAIWTDTRTATLAEPEGFEQNHGLSTMAAANPGGNGKTHEVRSLTLQAALQEYGIATVDILKLDIEGGEADVLASSVELFESHRIKHVIFEEHGTGHSKSIEILQRVGYVVHGIQATARGPMLAPHDESRHGPESYNLVASAATCELRRAFQPRGWLALTGR